MTVAARFAGAVVLVALLQPAQGAGPCCARCGATDGVRPVYRPVRTTMRVEYDAWDSVTEQLAEPSRRLWSFRTQGDGEGHFCRPACSTYTRNTLVKKQFVREVPVIKCAVEYVCERCRGDSPCVPPHRCAGGPRGGWLNVLLDKARDE